MSENETPAPEGSTEATGSGEQRTQVLPSLNPAGIQALADCLWGKMQQQAGSSSSLVVSETPPSEVAGLGGDYWLGVARRGELGGAVKWKAVCQGLQVLGLGGDYNARTFNRELTGPCVGGYMLPIEGRL